MHTAEMEVQHTDLTVPVQQLPYEALHQLGKNMEALKEDKSKKLIIEVEHNKDDEAKVSVKSKTNNNTELQ